MGYIGNEPTTGHFPVQTNLVGPGPTYPLTQAPATAGAIEVSVSGVLQPTTAYSVNGTTLTMAGVGTGVPIFIRYLGETLSIPTPADGSVTDAKIVGMNASKLTGTVPLAALGNAPATTLDSPVITGVLSVVDSGTVTHTIANWSDDASYTITPTNCTAGAVNASGQFVITHTSGLPSYTIKATTSSLGLGDSALTTKNLTMQLTAPTLSSPADSATATNVVYTITSTTANDDKLVLNIGSANFTYQSVSVGTASKVGNTVECIGFTTNNPAVTIQFTAQATYSVTAKAINIAGTYGTSVDSAADSITIANAIEATGGTESTYTYDSVDYVMHTFKSTGDTNFVVTSAPAGKTIDFLVIAGGGGGSAGVLNTTNGGAGGAGGLRWFTAQTPTASTYVATVGAGGAGGGSGFGSKGTNSRLLGTGIDVSATGGGRGGYNSSSGGVGGCGGGSSGQTPHVGGAGNEGSYTPVEGYGGNPGAGHNSSGSGGGGTGAVGVASIAAYGGAGGAGINNFLNQSSTAFTTAHTKAFLDAADNNNGLGDVDSGTRHIGGGGAGGHTGGTPSGGGGGLGGGGDDPTNGQGTSGDVNTGSGGGGNGHDQTSNATGAGGSGVIIIRYLA